MDVLLHMVETLILLYYTTAMLIQYYTTITCHVTCTTYQYTYIICVWYGD